MSTHIVISFRQNSDLQITIHLRTLSGGEPHPAAQRPTFNYSYARACSRFFLSVTASRLAVLMDLPQSMKVFVIWDWKSARVLFVRQSFSYSAKKLKLLSRS